MAPELAKLEALLPGAGKDRVPAGLPLTEIETTYLRNAVMEQVIQGARGHGVHHDAVSGIADGIVALVDELVAARRHPSRP